MSLAIGFCFLLLSMVYIIFIANGLNTSDKKRQELQNRLTTKDGSTFWVNTAIVSFHDETGKTYDFLIIKIDITKRKEAEKLLES